MHFGRKAVLAAASALAVVAALAVASAASAKSLAITPAPAWTADQLAAAPGNDWLSTGGNLANQRFSTLPQINTSNASSLQQAWMPHLDGSGAAAKYSQEDSPIENNGVLYVVTGTDDQYALAAPPGAHLWTYLTHTNQKNATVCCGWDARGVAVADGKVFVAQLDGSRVALDQMTGQV